MRALDKVIPGKVPGADRYGERCKQRQEGMDAWHFSGASDSTRHFRPGRVPVTCLHHLTITNTTTSPPPCLASSLNHLLRCQVSECCRTTPPPAVTNKPHRRPTRNAGSTTRSLLSSSGRLSKAEMAWGRVNPRANLKRRCWKS